MTTSKLNKEREGGIDWRVMQAYTPSEPFSFTQLTSCSVSHILIVATLKRGSMALTGESCRYKPSEEKRGSLTLTGESCRYTPSEAFSFTRLTNGLVFHTFIVATPIYSTPTPIR